MIRKSTALFTMALALFLVGCNYPLTSVATGDADVLSVDRPYRLRPTCLQGEPKRIDKVELLNLQTHEVTLLKPIFNAEDLYWTPTKDLNGRYRFQFTCEGQRCYSPAFVVDGALNEFGKPLRYDREDTLSRP